MSHINFEEQVKKIKLIAFDLDGTVTEGLIGYGEMAIPLMKQYNMKDFEAINELKKIFTIVVVTSDNRINYSLCRDKNIPMFYNPKSKQDSLRKAMLRYNVQAEEVIYIGSSFSDVTNCKMIPFSLCPSDAVHEVKRFAEPMESFAGYGVIAELHEVLRHEIIRRETLDK